MNLSVNAKDSMPGGGRLIIETACVELDEEYARFHEGLTPGLYVMLSMTDTGAGMSKEVQTRIFEPFFTTKDVSKGTGLGLSTVYGIVKQHKGHMIVYSEEGLGTTFKIFFSATVEEEKGEFSKDQTAMPRGSETILVVEDEASIRRLIVDTLQPLGYTVIEASGGEEALSVCDMKPGVIDLLMTDMIMPGMSGTELADAFATKRPETKIVFMSGYSHNWNTPIKILGKETTFMQKPLIPGSLAQKIREVLDEKGEAV
jgi:two-component system cell cycle sensor histidine kinase/response regulator CckA